MEKPALKRRVFTQILNVYSRRLVSLHGKHFACSGRHHAHAEHALAFNLEFKVLAFALEFLNKLTREVEHLHLERHVQCLRNAHHRTTRSQADVPIAIMPRTGEITLLQSDGDLTEEEFQKAIDLAMEGCMQVSELQKEALMKRYSTE